MRGLLARQGARALAVGSHPCQKRRHLGRISADSFDQVAGSLANMFDFDHPRDDTLVLDPVTGERPNGADDD
jgi:hypothetical protein